MKDISTKTSHVPVTLRLSLSTLQSVAFDAKQRGVPLSDWLEDAVNSYCAWGGDLDDEPVIPRATDGVLNLFAQAVENAPEILPETWSRLERLVRADHSLWVYPDLTVGQVEDGETQFEPYLNRAALAKAWPALVATASRLVD